MQETTIGQLSIYSFRKSLEHNFTFIILVNLILMVFFSVLSWPHFLNAEEKYQKAVEGLNPNPERHGSWFDIQQVTGTTLSAKVTSSQATSYTSQKFWPTDWLTDRSKV